MEGYGAHRPEAPPLAELICEGLFVCLHCLGISNRYLKRGRSDPPPFPTLEGDRDLGVAVTSLIRNPHRAVEQCHSAPLGERYPLAYLPSCCGLVGILQIENHTGTLGNPAMRMSHKTSPAQPWRSNADINLAAFWSSN